MYRSAALLILFLCSSPANGVEKVDIPSLDGKLKLHGYWFEAAATGPRPAIISLHGCGGLLDEKGKISRNRYRVAEYFNVETMHMLVLDSFTPRGIKSICEIPTSRRPIRYEDRREDVFAAIQWLAQQPTVDKNRIAVVGYSHGGGTVLSVLDRTEKFVRSRPLQPRAAIAYYPPCLRYTQMWNYEISAPLLLMIGKLDDWTPPDYCPTLRDKVKRAQPDSVFELVLYPDSHHGFDGYGEVKVRTGLATATGKATVGGNAAAREDSLRRMFDFLSSVMGTPLSLTHDERFTGHRYVVPPASGFAGAEDVSAVPLGDKGRARYKQYLNSSVPKAFVITEKKGFYYSADDAAAMQTAMEHCDKAKVKCWLYAVDDRVVWSTDVAQRVDLSTLKRK
jgi:dienelactone hydrolase